MGSAEHREYRGKPAPARQTHVPAPRHLDTQEISHMVCNLAVPLLNLKLAYIYPWVCISTVIALLLPLLFLILFPSRIHTECTDPPLQGCVWRVVGFSKQ